eukprot:2712341-Amphidinium_carterae.1
MLYGNFSGGRLWIEGAGCLPPPVELDPNRRYTHVRGGFLDAQSGDIVTFDASKLHGVETVST